MEFKEIEKWVASAKSVASMIGWFGERLFQPWELNEGAARSVQFHLERNGKLLVKDGVRGGGWAGAGPAQRVYWYRGGLFLLMDCWHGYAPAPAGVKSSVRIWVSRNVDANAILKEIDANRQRGWQYQRYARVGANDPTATLTPCLKPAVSYESEVIAALERDARSWIQNEEWYLERDLPWRRGWLLWGPPGNGKSSAVLEIAKRIERSVTTVDLSRMTNTMLGGLQFDRQGEILLLEDIDSIYDGVSLRPGVEGPDHSRLLNFLSETTRVLFVVTANNPDALSPALRRPGRLDLHFEVGPPGLADLERICRKMLRRDDSAMARSLLGKSMAEAVAILREAAMSEAI